MCNGDHSNLGTNGRIMIRIIIIFFCVTLSLNLYINRDEIYIPVATSAPQTVSTFDETVINWAQMLSMTLPDIQVTKTVAGNCLPVAVELQKLIAASGHNAIIVTVMPDELTVGHAMVMYNSEMFGDIDSLMDNGYATDFVVHPRSQLYDGTFGEYRGICSDPNPATGTCSVYPLITGK